LLGKRERKTHEGGDPGRQSAWKTKAGKRLFGGLLLLAGLCAAVYGDVQTEAASIHHSPASAPCRPVAIVFGAGYSAQGLSPVLADRVRTAVDLYRSHRVKKLLMTGDNSRRDYNEPEAMRQFAVALGVPERDIVLDYAGFRTYDSLFRARDIFGVRQALLVTQSYHLPRALYTAHRLGIDAEGVAAERRRYAEQSSLDRREVLAVFNAWLQTNITHPHPHFLGRREPIAL
jgi:SanA protein